MRYYLELADRQQAPLDGQPLRDLGPGCAECLRIAKAFDDVAAAGHQYDGGQLAVNDVAEPLVGGDEATIAFAVASRTPSALWMRPATGG